MQLWEYKLLNFSINLSAILKVMRWELEVDGTLYKRENEITDYLDTLGGEGWELVSSCCGADSHGNIPKVILFFKRPRGESN